MSESFGDILYMVEHACIKQGFTGNNPTNADILRAATQIYIEERKLEKARKEKDNG